MVKNSVTCAHASIDSEMLSYVQFHFDPHIWELNYSLMKSAQQRFPNPPQRRAMLIAASKGDTNPTYVKKGVEHRDYWKIFPQVQHT